MNRFFARVTGVVGCCVVLTACGGKETATGTSSGGSTGGTSAGGSTGGTGAGGSTGGTSTGGSTGGTSTGGGTGGSTGPSKEEQACDTIAGASCAQLETC